MEARGGGEVRRLHIIYFLSRLGRIEHPHLVRVHHLARNGVYLRDVKRWLGDLRGKDLPDAFAWSYKRRYKTGYVWQDLRDDDLITPVSDNEYVLKGSQINPTPLETSSLGGQKTSKFGEENSPQVQAAEDEQKQQPFLTEEPQIQKYPDSTTGTLTKVPSEISQDSLVFSSDMSTLADEVEIDKQNPDEQSYEKLENCTLPSLYRNLLNKKNWKQSKKDDMSKTTTTPDSSFSTSSSSSPSQCSFKQSSFKKSKSYSTGASGVFRNLISCGAADTNDAVLVMMNRAEKKGSNKSSNKLGAEICKADRLGGSARSFGTSWNHQKQQQQYGARRSCDGRDSNKNKKKLSEFITQTHYKPLGGPICSQCGKPFKPEKMHKHMKTCRGLKALAKSATSTSAENTVPHKSSSTSPNTDSTCNYLLFNEVSNM